jgi:pyruvate/2-oxoglutarate dehydrogenase complex dihydrolipoamide acyltransferase (E2) component
MSDKISLNTSQLTLRDLKRAKAGPLGGRSPFEVMNEGDQLEIGQLIAWCVRSRDDPEFTWADAEDLTLGDFEFKGADDDEPPPTGSSDEPGEPDATPAPAPSTSKPPAPEPNDSSATTSA